MAISLYRTMSLVRSRVSTEQIFFMVIVRFLETFVGSMTAGVGVGFTSALLFKYAGLNIDNLQNLECCLFVLFPYFSYMLAEGVGLSGIVSILFNGMISKVMKHYTYSNLSGSSQRFVSAFFHLISSLAETFTFIYMGFDIVMEQHSWSHVGFIFFSVIFMQVARGAMAFALILQSFHQLPEGHGQTIFPATAAIVVLTVLLIGGSTGTMLEALQVLGDDHGHEHDHEQDGLLNENFEGNNAYISPYDGESSSGNRFNTKLKEFQKSTASFKALDRNYLTPFFTNGDEDDEYDEPMATARGSSISDRD